MTLILEPLLEAIHGNVGEVVTLELELRFKLDILVTTAAAPNKSKLVGDNCEQLVLEFSFAWIKLFVALLVGTCEIAMLFVDVDEFEMVCWDPSDWDDEFVCSNDDDDGNEAEVEEEVFDGAVAWVGLDVCCCVCDPLDELLLLVEAFLLFESIVIFLGVTKTWKET